MQPAPELQSDSVAAEFIFPTRPDGSLGPTNLLIKVIAPNFAFASESQKTVRVHPTQDSPKVSFMLTARAAGVQRINIELYNADMVQIGNLFVTTAVNANELEAQPQASLQLNVMVVKSQSDADPLDAKLELSNGKRLTSRAWTVDASELPIENGAAVIVAGVVTDSETLNAKEAKKYFQVKEL